MRISYLESYILDVGFKISISLDCIVGGEDLMEVYIQQVTVAIREFCF